MAEGLTLVTSSLSRIFDAQYHSYVSIKLNMTTHIKSLLSLRVYREANVQNHSYVSIKLNMTTHSLNSVVTSSLSRSFNAQYQTYVSIKLNMTTHSFAQLSLRVYREASMTKPSRMFRLTQHDNALFAITK